MSRENELPHPTLGCGHKTQGERQMTGSQLVARVRELHAAAQGGDLDAKAELDAIVNGEGYWILDYIDAVDADRQATEDRLWEMSIITD